MTSPVPPHETKLKGGRYTLRRRLGEGSQGETFEASDNGSAAPPRHADLAGAWKEYVERARESGSSRAPTAEIRLGVVAIKRFRVDRAKTWKDVELAEREARTLASLDHPRLPKYIEHFEENGALYLVMEKIDGESLATIRKRRRTLDVAEVTRMLEDVAEALRYLHGRAPFIVHRDVKPGNVIRRPDGSYALVDFGAVRDRLKREGGSTVVGTFGYMAPEQFQGRASPKSDLYGLGATALTMLTGCEPEDLPHEGLGIDIARALPKSTPAPLVRALTAMLEPDPDRRAGSVDEALAFLRPSPRRKTAPPPEQLTRKQRRALRRQRKAEARAEKRRRRELVRGRSAPFLPRLVAKLGLLIAWAAVWLTVGLLVPLVLGLLSLLFGKALRRAAGACIRAAQRSHAALGRASAWLSGHRREDEATEPTRVRVLTELDPMRVETEAHAAESIAGDEQLAEAEPLALDEERPRSRRRSLIPDKRRR